MSGCMVQFGDPHEFGHPALLYCMYNSIVHRNLFCCSVVVDFAFSKFVSNFFLSGPELMFVTYPILLVQFGRAKCFFTWLFFLVMMFLCLKKQVSSSKIFLQIM